MRRREIQTGPIEDALLPKWDTSHGLLHEKVLKVAISNGGAGPFKRYLAGESNCPDPI